MKILSLTQPESVSCNKAVVRCIETRLRRFDEKLSWIVFSKFETEYGLAREDVIERPELFSKTMRQIFRFGSPYVEKGLIKDLKKEFQLEEKEYSGLADVVLEIRKSRNYRSTILHSDFSFSKPRKLPRANVLNETINQGGS